MVVSWTGRVVVMRADKRAESWAERMDAMRDG
jgi:hypothetical protein